MKFKKAILTTSAICAIVFLGTCFSSASAMDPDPVKEKQKMIEEKIVMGKMAKNMRKMWNSYVSEDEVFESYRNFWGAQENTIEHQLYKALDDAMARCDIEAVKVIWYAITHGLTEEQPKVSDTKLHSKSQIVSFAKKHASEAKKLILELDFSDLRGHMSFEDYLKQPNLKGVAWYDKNVKELAIIFVQNEKDYEREIYMNLHSKEAPKQGLIKTGRRTIYRMELTKRGAIDTYLKYIFS